MQQEAVIGGVTEPSGARHYFITLMLHSFTGSLFAIAAVQFYIFA
jgi:hypothetical protein